VVDAWGLWQVADVVELLALELVSVAVGPVVARPCYRDVRHVRLVELRIQLAAEGLVVATWDEDPRPPRCKQPGTGYGDGSALYFVPMLAEAWDFFSSAGGKVVWAEVAMPPPGQGRLPRRTRISISGARLAATPDPVLLERVRDCLLALDK
jgi:hypothetical protein